MYGVCVMHVVVTGYLMCVGDVWYVWSSMCVWSSVCVLSLHLRVCVSVNRCDVMVRV